MNADHNLVPLRRCRHCGAWQKDSYALCLFCGGDLAVGRVQRVLRHVPGLVVLTLLAAGALIAVLVTGGSTAAWMSALTIFACTLTFALTMAPSNTFGRMDVDPRRAEIALKPLKTKLKALLEEVNAAGDETAISPLLVLLLHRLSLLRHGNRSAPLIFGYYLAGDRRMSKTARLKSTIQRLNEVDRSWSSQRLSTRPEAQEQAAALIALLKSVRAKPRTWIERLREHNVGTPMPFIDIEPQLLEIDAQCDALQARTTANTLTTTTVGGFTE